MLRILSTLFLTVILFPDDSWARDDTYIRNGMIATGFIMIVGSALYMYMFENSPKSAGFMILAGIILVVGLSIAHGTIVISNDGIPFNVAIGVVSSVIAAILLKGIGRR